MGDLLLITDDPRRAEGLARDLDTSTTCRIHDLYADALPSGRPELIVSVIEALTSDAILRLRAWTSRDAGWKRNVLRSEANTLAKGSSCEPTVSRVAGESKSWLAWAVAVRNASLSRRRVTTTSSCSSMLCDSMGRFYCPKVMPRSSDCCARPFRGASLARRR